MIEHPGRPQLRDLWLALPVGLLVLGTLPVTGRWGSEGGPGTGGPGPDSPEHTADGSGGSWTWDAGEGPDLTAYLLAVLAVAAVALRRWPLLAIGLSTGASTLHLALGNPYGPILVTVAITAFSLARRVALPRSGIAAGLGVLVLLAHGPVSVTPLDGLLEALPLSAWVVVPWCIGLARRQVLETRTRRREDAQRSALDAERLRLASEVHDVVGHGLAAIQMQADIALHVAERRPAQALEALEVISRASAEALAELRTTLAAVSPQATSAETHAPTPGLDRLEDLCARMRDAGVDVELEISGARRAVPSAVGIAVYRIVQESLTNVVKHAAEHRAHVRVAYLEEAIELSVLSPAEPGEEVREGFGIAGIRRRAADVGGTAEVETDGSRFRVQAVLPA